MYDMTREELIAAAEAEDRAWLDSDDIHPYKSRVPKTKGNTVLFPKITKFSAYLLRHYGAEIVEEINSMMYDGELAGICGVDGFHSQQLTRDKCRIDPRMSFWRVNKYEFIADIAVYLKASVYSEDSSWIENYTLYVSLNFSIDERVIYTFGNVSLQQPERDQMKLDDYLIPILNIREVNAAAEDQWFVYIPEALHDHRYLNPFRLAEKMGLSVVYHRLYKNHKTKSILFWSETEVEITPKDGDEKSPPIVVTIPAGTILINENAVHKDMARLSVYHECFHDEYHWLFYRLQEMHNNDLRKIKKTRKPKNQSREPKNPLTILEWEAKQGSRALMMPECIMRPMIEQFEKEEWKIHKHAGRVFQGVGYSITCSAAGSSSSSKVLTFKEAKYQAPASGLKGSDLVGTTLGTLTGKFYNNTTTHTLNASTNASLFSKMAAYFAAGNQTLVIHNGETSSSSGYSTNYARITSITITVTYVAATVWYNNNGTWVQCAVYYCNDGTWVQVTPYYNSGGTWIQV